MAVQMRSQGLRGHLKGLGLELGLLMTLLLVDTCQGTHCWRRKYYISFTGRAINATLQCDDFYQWTVSDYCCYDGYDRFDMRPYCCRSETFKLLSAVGTICGTVLAAACFLFIWWYANLSHHLLRLLTCGKFNLNEFAQKRKLTGPYVDPSFYAGEPFWTPGGSELYPYPLRPMPPRIFYPALPSSYKGLGRWSGSSTRLPHGQMPLFVLASRQFTRKPYSARPNQPRTSSTTFSGNSPGNGQDGGNSSRRSSTSSMALELHNAQRMGHPSFGFRVQMDEVEAAAELLEALKYMEEKGEKAFTIPRLLEETQGDLELESEFMDRDVREEQQQRFQDYLNLATPSPPSILNIADTPLHMPTRVASALPSPKPSLIHTRLGSTESSTFALDSVMEEKQRNGRMTSGMLKTHYSEDEAESSSNIPGFIPDPEQPGTKNTAPIPK